MNLGEGQRAKALSPPPNPHPNPISIKYEGGPQAVLLFYPEGRASVPATFISFISFISFPSCTWERYFSPKLCLGTLNYPLKQPWPNARRYFILILYQFLCDPLSCVGGFRK